MKFETINMGAYRLHLIKTNKFKTITVEVNFRRKVKKEEIKVESELKDTVTWVESTKNQVYEAVKKAEEAKKQGWNR